MAEEKQPELTEEELEPEVGELLPDREQMAVIQPIERIGGGGITIPVEPPATE